MSSSVLNVFSLSECENLKKLLKNPKEDFQEILSLLETKVEESNKQFRELNEKYHSLVDGLTHVGIGIDIVSNDYEVLFQNQVLKERFGDCRGKNCYRSYMNLEKPCEFCPMEEALKYNRVERIELKAADGRFYELISAPYPNQDGTIDKVAEVVIDITERKKAEVKLIESENKYKNLSNELETIIDIIPGMLFVKNKNDTVTHVNQNFADSLNLEKEQIIGKTSFDLFPVEQAEDFRKDDLEVITSGEPKLNIEESADFPDGKIWAITNKTPYYNDKGETRGIVGLAIDITDRKHIEQKLKESEEKYRGLVNNITDIIFELGINGKCTYVSNQLFEISGFHPEEMIGQNVFQYLHPEDLLNVTEKVKEAFQKGIRISIDFRIRHKDGFYVPVSSNFNVIRINGEQRFIGVLRDNTEKKQAEIKLKESEEKFRTLAEQSFLGIAILQNNIVRYVNKQLADTFGYTVEEIMDWGKGAFLNNERISVSKRKTLDECFLATGFPYIREDIKDSNIPEFSKFLMRTRGLRRLGSAALDLAYVACGRLDGFWEKHLKLWDISAGGLLVLEAGGRVSNFYNNNWDNRKDNIVASNGKIHREMIKIIKGVRQG